MSTRKSKAIASLVALAILTVGLYSLMREREPRYQGKSLSAWLSETARIGEVEGENDPGKVAVRQMGTNAIPSLLEMLRRKKDSPFALKIMALTQRFDSLRSILAPKVAVEENQLAVMGFNWLGPVASNAAPHLIEIYHQNLSESSQLAALTSLFDVAPAESHDLLSEALTNPYDSVRRTALWLTPADSPGLSIPCLIKGLRDASPRVQNVAALKLCQFGTNALPAVPALVRLACSAPSNTMSDSGPWYTAGMTLCLVDPQTAAKVLTNGYWTFEKYADDLGLFKAMEEAITNDAVRVEKH